jgi:hypothetical protein
MIDISRKLSSLIPDNDVVVVHSANFDRQDAQEFKMVMYLAHAYAGHVYRNAIFLLWRLHMHIPWFVFRRVHLICFLSLPYFVPAN